MTRIARVDVEPVALPRVVHGRAGQELGRLEDVLAVLVRVHTDDGLTGIGYTMTLTPAFGRSLVALVRDIADIVTGRDSSRPVDALAPLVLSTNWIGPGGMLNIAASAFDVALWDLQAQRARLPLWRLLGGADPAPRVYDSGSLLTVVTDLEEAVAGALESGYRGIKMRPGALIDAAPVEIARKVARVREAVGGDVALMLDINQAWDVPRAIRVGRELESLALTWIEDPVPLTDIAGLAAVSAALDTPISAGEYHYGVRPLAELVDRRAVDILMIDLMRVGGITGFRSAAAIAEVSDVPVVSHLLPELYGQLIGSIPHGRWVEGMPWTAQLFANPPEVRDGRMILRETPGHGLELDASFVSAHRIG
jgi:L-talarate/galactarate dehydratase